ncbi:winged helix-turn-helix transcriptional regulator [Microbispora sp. CA-102843]|uniref:winged helix-turn-helix transcriptional regulator n=1 Tax=Microbispora sp. CA-102843 TaxID=3239952 RepID=UPI003D8B0615
MAGKREYDDPCGVARALDVVGERWALLVVRELLLGPKRFGDLSRGLPGMSPNVLSQRLRELEQAGVVRRRRLGPPAAAQAYELTERGRELDDVLLVLARWGSRAPLTTGARLGVDALVLALRTTFDPAAAQGWAARCELRIGDDRFDAVIGPDGFRVVRGCAERPGAVVTADPEVFRALVFGGRPLAAAIEAGEVRVEGDRRMAERFLACFPRPVPAS